MTVEVADTLAFLLGNWAIERMIEDHRDGTTVHFRGTAEVSPVRTGALYTETGQVSTAAHTGPARRVLRLLRRDDGTVRLDFADGRPFLDLDLSSGAARASHPCRADTYEMAFEVRGADELAETWRVTGPAKDYSATTIWHRR